MTSTSVPNGGRFTGVIALSPRVLLFASALAIFPFISTVTGASLKLAGVEIWKYLWLLWLGGLAVHVVWSKGFFVKRVGRIEPALWLFIAFMLVFAPRADLVIDPWKNWFFCTLAVVLFRLLAIANADELRTMVKSALAVWSAYVLILVVYSKSVPYYPGSIQHQFFLSGLLGLVAGLLLLLRQTPSLPKEAVGRRWYWLVLVATLVNVVVNLTITEARSVFPFSLALVVIATAWLFGPARSASRLLRRLGLPIALLITLFPVLHLNGAMGNLLNELTYPVFGKYRTIESKTGREVAFQIWSEYAIKNANLLGPTKTAMPTISQEVDESEQPLFGMSSEEFRRLKIQGMEAQSSFRERQRRLGVELNQTKPESSPVPATMAPTPTPPSETMAITSSHNLWLDAASRSGILYAAAIALAFGFVLWAITARVSLWLPGMLVFGYWALAVAWGIASQFDDEHWLYHIPYLTLFFIPVIIAACRRLDEQVASAAVIPGHSQTSHAP